MRYGEETVSSLPNFEASSHQRAGFALVASISIMAVMVLIAVALFSLASVANRSATIASAQVKAQANAKTALMMAIGELQSELGPDQRISANASILDTPQENPEDEQMDVINPQWLGVWDSWVAGDPAKAPVNPDYPNPNVSSHHQTIGQQPDASMRPEYAKKDRYFRKWLVSLNPNRENAINPADPESANKLLNAGPTPRGSSNAVRLVGTGTLGTSATSSDYVEADLIGIADQGTSLSGRYAWWAGDESQKVRIMDDSYQIGTPSSDAEKIFRSQAPASTGTQAIDGLANVTDQSKLVSIPSTKTLDLISGSTTTSPSQRFHDISVHSMSLVTDVREGGLKRDLSFLLERPIDPEEVFDFNAPYLSDRDYKSVSGIKPGGDDFMLYRFDDRGLEYVPIQDLSAYYQLYDYDAHPWMRERQEGVAYSSDAISDGLQLSYPDYGEATTQEKYIRAYTSLYRQPIPIKIQFLLATKARKMHPSTEAEYLNNPLLPGYNATHFLTLSISASVTMWNPSNLPVAMKGSDLDAQRIDFGVLPLWIEINKSGYRTGAMNLSWLSGTSGIWHNPTTAADGVFKASLAATRDVIFQPGEVKVFSYPLTVDYNSSNLDYYDLELIDGLEPSSFIEYPRSASSSKNPAKMNDKRATKLDAALNISWHEDKPGESFGNPPLDPRDVDDNLMYSKLMFNASDTISIELGTSEYFELTNDGSRGPELGWSDKRLKDEKNKYITFGRGSGLKFSFMKLNENIEGGAEAADTTEQRNYQFLSRVDLDYSAAPGVDFNSELMEMGFSSAPGGSGIKNILISERTGSDIINYADYDGNWAFMHFSLMAACEMGGPGSTDVSAGRKYANRPFLHSTAMASPFIDKTDAASLYNYGWSWWAGEINDQTEAGIQLDTNNRGYYGGGYTLGDGTTHVIQQEVPITPPLSIAALSHAHLGGFSLATDRMWGEYNSDSEYRTVTAVGSMGLFPHTIQAIGNSYAHPNLPADKAFAPWEREIKSGDPSTITFADHSYLANKALWDEFFFSSIMPKRSDVEVFDISVDKTAKETAEEFFFPADGEEPAPLPNRRMQAYKAGLDHSKLDALFSTASDFNDGLADKIATHLMVEGGFNINSTSTEAWEALIKSLREKPVNYLNTDSNGSAALQSVPTFGTAVGFGFVSNSLPITEASTDSNEPNQWTGSRVLSDTEVEELAAAIVKQVKLRGPFLSLSEFINRRLESGSLGTKGALQAALDDPNVSINQAFRVTGRELNSSDIPGAAFPEALEGPAAYGSAAYIDQADVLRSLAGQLTPRGDTFVIRAYGDTLDPSGEAIASAWCEAVVQRIPDYVDSSIDPETKQANLTGNNMIFGRKFKVTSFRWLNPSEI